MLPFATRRDMLKSLSCGFGYLAFAGLASEQSARAAGFVNPLAEKPPHFKPRAKRIIMLYMRGGPTHVDTFDYKPKLQESAGMSFRGGDRARGSLLASPWKFNPSGTSGLPISELFPHIAKHA